MHVDALPGGPVDALPRGQASGRDRETEKQLGVRKGNIDQESHALPSLLCPCQASMATAVAGRVSDLHQDKGRNFWDTEEQMCTWSHKRSPCLPKELLLLNRYKALKCDRVADKKKNKKAICANPPFKFRSAKVS